jgi:hypothetical protein
LAKNNIPIFFPTSTLCVLKTVNAVKIIHMAKKIITLTTDFGLEDGYVGVMKGVILSIAPDVDLVDLTHQIRPQDVAGAALTLERSCSFFPAGTIHLVVVDPGVGTSRRKLAARIGDAFFVGPDNGFISLVAQKARREHKGAVYFSLDRSDYWRSEVSNVFHGRDIFAPAAAHLARGVPIENMGSRIDDPVCLPFRAPSVGDFGWVGEVIHVDHFGNLATNLREEHLAGLGAVRVVVSGEVINGLKRTYGDGQPGELVALIDSAGYLSIALVNGNAQASLKINLGDPVEIYLQ